MSMHKFSEQAEFEIGPVLIILLFWGLGLFLLFRQINSIGIRNSITFKEDYLELTEKLRFNKNIYIIRYDNIKQIGLRICTNRGGKGKAGLDRIKFGRYALKKEAVFIMTPVEIYYFLVLANESEQEWATEFLDQEIKKRIQ